MSLVQSCLTKPTVEGSAYRPGPGPEKDNNLAQDNEIEPTFFH